MSIIRYRFKANKDFESVKIDGMSCSLGELKRLIAGKLYRSGTDNTRDDYDLIISNANTNEEYKDHSDLIPRNASVIVARRFRGSVDTLTPTTYQKPVVNSDDIIKDFLRPVILNQNSATIVETNAVPLEQLSETNNTTSAKEMTEEEMIKEIQAGSHARYVTTQPAYRTNLFICHHCKQPGHIKSKCPSFLQSSLNNNNSNSTSSTGGDANSTSNPSSGRPHGSHIVTRHAPYQMNHHYHHRGNRSHRGGGHPREPIPKKTTGIPRDRLIPVPKHIPGALRDQTGASVVPRQVAELFVEISERKQDALAQPIRQSDEKNVSSSIPNSSKTIDEEIPNDLLCPLCKRVFTDAVITPCCNFSFCDECIRTALIESPDHECPMCHCQHVAIDQINPNLYLRNHIKRWHERQNQSAYSHLSLPQQTIEQDNDTTSTTQNLSNETDEYDPMNVTPISHQANAPTVKVPIVIKMQPRGDTPSPPQSMAPIRSADTASKDDKESDFEQTIQSQKSVHTNEESTDLFRSISTEVEKAEGETPPIQTTTPINPMYQSSSPTTIATMPPQNAVVPHYYPAPQHHNVLYPHHIPPTSTNGLYPIQPNYYPPPMSVRYPPAGIPHYQGYPPGPPIHHHPPPAPHAMIPTPHIPTNGYNMPPFHPHPQAPFTSTSTFIAHHQTATTQPITTTLSKDEFYIKQRYFQRMQKSPNSSRRRSRSSSYSSYSSSDSRSSSRSRYNRRRRSSRSRSRSRRRVKSPSRDNRRQRRSSSYRDQRRRPVDAKEKYSTNTKYRRSPPRPSREQERRRSPRPPPTVQQSTQRTIVYMQESSHSTRDRRRSRSRSSRGANDDRMKKETQSQPEPTPPSSTIVTPTTLSSKVEAVVDESNDKTQEETTKNGKKHKKHHKKHRHSSKSKKHHRSKDKEKKEAVVDAPTSVVEVQS